MIRSAFNAVSKSNDNRDVADCINEYFDDFEYKVYTNRFSQIDKRIPFLIIRKFRRLFEIWDENVIFSKFLEGDSFREIFTLMYNVFGANSNKCSTTSCYLECELCGEEIILRNNDPEYSYRLHEMSKYHLEFIRNMRAFRSKEDVDVIFSQTMNDEGIFLECHLCLISFPIAKRDENNEYINAHLSVMESHQQDEKHQTNIELYNSNKSRITVYNVEEKLYACSACEEVYHVDLLMDHLRNTTHQENLTKERVSKKNTDRNDSSMVQKADFEVFKTNMKLIHVVDDLIQCLLCESDLSSVNMVVEHLTGKQHTENLQEYMSKQKLEEKADQLEEISCSNQEYQQPIGNDPSVEEIPPKNTYVSRYLVSKSNFIPLCGLFVFAISILLSLIFDRKF